MPSILHISNRGEYGFHRLAVCWINIAAICCIWFYFMWLVSFLFFFFGLHFVFGWCAAVHFTETACIQRAFPNLIFRCFCSVASLLFLHSGRLITFLPFAGHKYVRDRVSSHTHTYKHRVICSLLWST